MKFVRVGAAVGAVAIIVTACSSTPSGSGAAAGGTPIKVGIELPMTGGEAPNGVPTANGVQLALEQLKVDGYNITINQQDDAVNGKHNADQGAKNMQTLANDPEVLFVIGPYNSSVAQAEIPVTNAAGLMQCSPANTAVQLTKPWGNAKPTDLRTTNPDKIAYVRVAATDDIQGAGGADIAANTLNAKTAYVLDDTQTYGKGVADAFETAFKTFGGTVAKRDGVPDTTTDFTSYVTTAKGLNPDVIFYGGVTTSGLGLFRKQMAQQGLDIPMVGADGIVDGSAATASSFLNIAGDGDANTYGTSRPSTTSRTRTSSRPTTRQSSIQIPGPYSAPGYACAQVFLQALKAVGASAGGDMAKLREAIRAYVADPANSYDTVLGKFNFDKDGDTSQHVISYYQFDPTAKDWKFLKQRDFTAEPVQ